MDNTDRIKLLLEACQTGNLDKIKELVEDKINPVSPNSYGIVNGKKLYPILLISCWPLLCTYINENKPNTEEKYWDCATYLMSKGASLDEIVIKYTNGDGIDTSYSIRDGLKVMHKSFLEKCEHYEKEILDTINIKTPDEF